MRDIQILIISWANQHQNAASIAVAVRSIVQDVAIVYSDPDPSLSIPAECPLIRRPDNLFFGDKFKACLDAYRSDLMLVIHADCTCDDWAGLVRKCRAAMSAYARIGVWAPLIDYTGFSLARTRIGEIPACGLSLVAHTDSIVFAMPRPVIERMQAAAYEQNVYGWGIGWLAVAHAYANRKYAVVDRSISVRHPRPRGYSSGDAAKQREEFLQQMLPEEVIQYRLLQSHMSLMDLQNAGRRMAPPSKAA